MIEAGLRTTVLDTSSSQLLTEQLDWRRECAPVTLLHLFTNLKAIWHRPISQFRGKSWLWLQLHLRGKR